MNAYRTSWSIHWRLLVLAPVMLIAPYPIYGQNGDRRRRLASERDHRQTVT